MRSRKSATDVKFPRFSNRRTKMLHQSSIWFSQLLCCGVERKRMRWLASLKNAARVGIDCTRPRFSFSPHSSVMPHTRATSLTNPVTILFGQTPATILYAGLAPNFVGLYQFNVQVPNVSAGDWPLVVQSSGTAMGQSVNITTGQ